MPPTLTKIQHTTLFQQVDQLYQSCFGAASVPTQTQYAWWQKQPDGIIALQENNNLIGAASLWSISPQAFERFSAGILRERDLSSDDLSSNNEGYLYLSEVALQPSHRNRGLSYYLLRGIMLTIEEKFNRLPGKKALQVLALGYSTEGKVILQKMGFEKIREATETADEQALFCLTIQSRESIRQEES
jgi:Acetyltransferase (GNAT) family